MGLELVEYVVAIEEAFEIAIPNADARHLDTPNKLIDYLCERLGESPDGPPLIQTAFYHLRNAIVEELRVSRSRVTPHSTLAELTDRSEREVWKAVATRLDVSPKALSHASVLGFLAKFGRAPDRSIGDVAKQIAMVKPAALKTRGKTWTRAQIREVVTRLLEYEIGLSIAGSQLDATFIQDLGMG